MYVQVCAYEFVCMFMCVEKGVHRCLCVHRETIHICVCVYGGQKSTSLFFETGSLIALRCANLERQANPGILLRPPPKSWDYKLTLPCPALCVGAGNLTQVLLLTPQALCPLSHPSSSRCCWCCISGRGDEVSQQQKQNCSRDSKPRPLLP